MTSQSKYVFLPLHKLALQGFHSYILKGKTQDIYIDQNILIYYNKTLKYED